MHPAFFLLFLATTVRPALPPQCTGWPAKPAWEWTDSERLTHLSDVACTAARKEVAANVHRRDGSCSGPATANSFVFGTDTPELFFPYELFDALLTRAFLAEPDFTTSQRTMLSERAKQAGISLPTDFWQKIDRAAATYVTFSKDVRDMEAALRHATSAERAELVESRTKASRALCGVRIDALDRVRASFDAELFDKFLYLVIAPGLCASSEDVGRQDWLSRGCRGDASPPQ